MNLDCIRCFKPMRPLRTKAKDHPGTVSWGGRGMCQTCYRIEPDYQPPAGREAETLAHNRASLEAYLNRRRPFRVKAGTQ